MYVSLDEASTKHLLTDYRPHCPHANIVLGDRSAIHLQTSCS